MAFAGIFLMMLLFVLGFVFVCTFVAVVLLIASFRKEKKELLYSQMAAQQGVAYEPQKKKYMVHRVISIIFFLPLAGLAGLIVYASISTRIEHFTSLSYNVSQGNIKAAERLLKYGVDPDCTKESNAPAKDGEKTLLMEMCEANGFYGSYSSDKTYDSFSEEEAEMVKLLIKYGADVNHVCYTEEKNDSRHTGTDEESYFYLTDGCGATPLMAAAKAGSVDLMKILVENGADINQRDYCGYNAAAYIADGMSDSQCADAMEYLIENGADTKTPTNFGQSFEFLSQRHSGVNNERIKNMIIHNNL